MWQVLLAAAAAAGSTGLVARHLFSPGAKRCEGADQNEKETNPFDDDAKYISPVVLSGLNEFGYESNSQKQNGIFRFSSPESAGKSGSKTNGRKKRGIGAEKVKKDKRSGGGVEVSKRRVAVCLKKRKTNRKNVAANCGSCSSKDSSLFNWGLGVGIMYMMSAGKAEISKLSTTMGETAKVVQELRSEISRRKSPRSVQVLNYANKVSENLEKIRNKQTQQVLIKSRIYKDLNDLKAIGKTLVDDGECTSSVLTEEQDTEVLEIDQLEAELESELQKLPWYSTEDSCQEDMKLNLNETEVSAMGFRKLEGQSSDCYQSHGVSPSELDQKLSHVLIEQQENQIMDLESELYSAQLKLREKEAELQALKDCVRRLTEFSLSAIPDDGTEAQEEQECSSKWDCSNEVGLEFRPIVGMKRPIDAESCNSYYVK